MTRYRAAQRPSSPHRRCPLPALHTAGCGPSAAGTHAVHLRATQRHRPCALGLYASSISLSACSAPNPASPLPEPWSCAPVPPLCRIRAMLACARLRTRAWRGSLPLASAEAARVTRRQPPPPAAPPSRGRARAMLLTRAPRGTPCRPQTMCHRPGLHPCPAGCQARAPSAALLPGDCPRGANKTRDTLPAPAKGGRRALRIPQHIARRELQYCSRAHAQRAPASACTPGVHSGCCPLACSNRPAPPRAHAPSHARFL